MSTYISSCSRSNRWKRKLRSSSVRDGGGPTARVPFKYFVRCGFTLCKRSACWSEQLTITMYSSHSVSGLKLTASTDLLPAAGTLARLMFACHRLPRAQTTGRRVRTGLCDSVTHPERGGGRSLTSLYANLSHLHGGILTIWEKKQKPRIIKVKKTERCANEVKMKPQALVSLLPLELTSVVLKSVLLSCMSVSSHTAFLFTDVRPTCCLSWFYTYFTFLCKANPVSYNISHVKESKNRDQHKLLLSSLTSWGKLTFEKSCLQSNGLGVNHNVLS